MSKTLIIHFSSGKKTEITNSDVDLNKINLDNGLWVHPATAKGVPTLINLRNVEMLELIEEDKS